MTSLEFDKKESIYKNIETNTFNQCIESDVDFYNYLGWFVRYGLKNYINYKNLISTIENLDFSNETLVKSILNKKHFGSKKDELEEAKEKFKNHRLKLFNWLDKTNNPYFFILNPVYHYGAGISYNSWFVDRYGYKKLPQTGSGNIDIAVDYTKYKLEININHLKETLLCAVKIAVPDKGRQKN